MNKQLPAWFFSGLITGFLTGGLVGLSYDAFWTGALIGGIALAAGEVLTGLTRPQGQIKPFWYRLLNSALFGAALAALLAWLFPTLPILAIGLALGFLTGLLGFNLNKVLLGLLIGGGLALGSPALGPLAQPALLGALIVLVFRLLSALFFRGSQPLQLNAEQVPKEKIHYVVPFEARSRYIGAGYFEDLARDSGGSFERNRADIGIVESFDCLQGPQFDPAQVHPLIREFYEHTSRFKLQIVPEWDWRYRPLFWWFKRSIAQPLGQANLPFNQEEAQRGVVSYIDTIDFDADDIVDLRGWVRAFENSGEAIYVGVYTTFRHAGAGYVSVGFPLPESNFTATLLPFNLPAGNFVLKTRDTGMDYPGHYLSTSGGTEELVVLKLPTFDEAIEVFVRDGDLFTDHRFFIGGRNFLTLHYSMSRLQPGQ